MPGCGIMGVEEEWAAIERTILALLAQVRNEDPPEYGKIRIEVDLVARKPRTGRVETLKSKRFDCE